MLQKGNYVKELTRREKQLFVFKVIVAGIVCCFVYVHRQQLMTLDIQGFVAATPSLYIAAIIVLGIFALKSVVFIIPAMLIYVAVGAAFPLWQAVLINLVGITTEVLITYYLGRFLGGDKVCDIISRSKNGEKLLETLENRTGTRAMFVIRFLPTPIDFVSLFFGSIKTPLCKYLFTSITGIYPRVFFFTTFGDVALRFLAQSKGLPRIKMKYIIPAIVVVFIIFYIKRKNPK